MAKQNREKNRDEEEGNYGVRWNKRYSDKGDIPSDRKNNEILDKEVLQSWWGIKYEET